VTRADRWSTQVAVSRRGDRLVAALPDAVTAAFFLTLWIAPLAFGLHGVRNAMLVMLVEFVLIHATGGFGASVFREDLTRAKRFAFLFGTSLFYLLFVSTFALIFEAWWPFLAFAWLLVGKLAMAVDPRRTSTERRVAMQRRWVQTAIVYLLGVFATVILPLPRLGITADVTPHLGLTGSGLWIEQPHTVIAFGTLYFGVLAALGARQAMAAAEVPRNPRDDAG
jgi:hypothetical protein